MYALFFASYYTNDSLSARLINETGVNICINIISIYYVMTM